MTNERDLTIASQSGIFIFSEDELEVLGYTPRQLDALEENLPEPFLMNFFWDGSARKIDEKEQRRILAMIKNHEFDEFAY